MTAHHDAAFFRMFMFVLGALVAFTFAIMILASIVSDSLEQTKASDPTRQAAIEGRVAPIGQVRVADQSVAAAPPAVQSEVASEPVAAAEAVPTPTSTSAAGGDLAHGEQIYQTACFACHLSGAAGAPKLGDPAAWAPRLAQGNDAMLASVINGKGAMPPKGGRVDLSDGDVAAAVAFMLSKVQ